jgi:hypothetical protein
MISGLTPSLLLNWLLAGREGLVAAALTIGSCWGTMALMLLLPFLPATARQSCF